MEQNHPIIKIFMLSRQAGAGVTCCGAVGQTDEQIQHLIYAIATATGYQIEVHDISNRDVMQKYRFVRELMSMSGVKALPIVTLDETVVSTGKFWPEPVISAIKENINR